MLNGSGETSVDNESKDVTAILIADDHPLVRQALISLLNNQPDLKVVGEACNGEEAIQLAGKLRPNVAIIDITMPGINGLNATKQIKSMFPEIEILILTVHSDIEHISGIFEAGASGYLTKSVFGNEIVTAVRSIMAGGSVLSKHILKQILEINLQKPFKPNKSAAEYNLTSRELEIFKMASSGMSNKDIAQRLNLSLQTVKGYLVSIFSKLGVNSRTKAVILGLRTGILMLKDLDQPL